MEEMEIMSWLTLDAVRERVRVVETVGNLQTAHSMSVFGIIEDDFLELAYSDSAANILRRFENRDEFDVALEARKEEDGEAPFEEDDHDYDEDEEDKDEELGVEDDSESS
jgi:hypothetical protein